ncbi:hypothetical protein Tco_1321044, partial [Tanacetum coccineum]
MKEKVGIGALSKDQWNVLVNLLNSLKSGNEKLAGAHFEDGDWSGSYTSSRVTIPVVPATDESPEVPKRTAVETILNMSPENKPHYESEKKAIHLLLTGIGDEIYSTVDAYKTAHEMWIAIKRLQQESMKSYYSRFYKMMNEMIRNNLTIAMMQVNVQFLQKLQPKWSRFVIIVKQQHDLDIVSYHKLFDVLKQYQKEVNEIRAEIIAKNANPLALVSATQQYPDPYYQAPKPHRSFAPPSKQSSSTRSNATTKYKGKEIAKPTTPLSESGSVEKLGTHCKNDNQNGQFGNQRKVIVVGARETVGGLVKDYSYHKEKMLLCKQVEKGIPLQSEQADWLADTDEEIDEQELEAHYSYMAKIQKVPTADSDPLEHVDSNVIPDSPDMCDNDIQTDQNAEECDDERAALANLIANLKLDVDENKKIQKQLKKANTSLNQELNKCKFILAETSRTLWESNSTRDSCLIALQSKQTELETYKTLIDRTVDYDKLERLVKEKTKVITDLKLKEEKDIDKMISMESQLMFLNEIVYKRNQSIQSIHMLAPKGSTFNGRPTFANLMYLKKAQSEKPCLYEIPYDTSNPTNRFVPDREETLTLKKENRSKLNKDLVKPYDYTKQNSLYENFKPVTQEYHEQLAHANE